MEKLTTKEAFTNLISQRGIYKQLDESEEVIRNLRRNLKLGKVSIDKMEELLSKAGFSVIQEKLWLVPPPVPNFPKGGIDNSNGGEWEAPAVVRLVPKTRPNE